MFGWLSPPTRREISLILFSITVFILGYNLDASLRTIGLDPVATQSAVFTRLGLGGSSVIDRDGRRPKGWRDALEKEIFGDWRWEEGQVAGDGAERSALKGSNRYGAQWLAKEEIEPVWGEGIGNSVASEGIWNWGGSVPKTRVVKHVPGYSIIDNLIMSNGTVYLVTNSPSSLPPLASIFSNANKRELNQWKIINSADASILLGQAGGRIRGVTFLSTDTSPHNSTLLALWRTYSSLDPNITPQGETTLPPPARLFFSSIPIFSDERPDDLRVRSRSDLGFHLFLPKTAFPSLLQMYQADWEDYMGIEAPFLIERAVVADRIAAQEHMDKDAKASVPVFAGAFEELGGRSKFWMEPLRRTLAAHLGVPADEKGRGKRVITFIKSSGERGARLKAVDEAALVTLLIKMGRDYGYVIHVVSDKDWVEKMKAVVQSTIILGVTGEHMFDSAFIRPSPQSAVIELFSEGRFIRDIEVIASSTGTRYVALWGKTKMSGQDLPNAKLPPMKYDVPIDVPSIIKAITDELTRTS